MSLQTRMNEMNTADSKKAAMREALYKSERAYRLDKRVDAWSQVPEIGDGLLDLNESTARNVACNLDNQAQYMGKLSEAQMSQGFRGFTPENMLRLVRLSMPNCIRSELFTEFAMETMRDSIKYVRPVYSKTANGNELIDKTEDYARLYNDPTGDDTNDINRDDYRRPIYESTEDRINQELANVPGQVDGATSVKFEFKAQTETFFDSIAATAANKKDWAIASKKWGDNGEKYLDGFVTVYYGNEKNVIALQDKRTKKFFIGPVFAKAGLTAEKVTITETGVPTVTVDFTAVDLTKISDAEKVSIGLAKEATALDLTAVKAYGRYDSEDDFEGDYLGEVEIKMSDYFFNPRPTAIGVSWSQLTELSLDTSFSMSAEEYLVTYASQAIRVALDYRAIKEAYKVAKTNPAQYHVEFDAAYNTTNAVAGSNGTKEGYIENAQTFLSAVSTMADNMLNDINRGNVTKMVCGPSAGTYLTLLGAYSSRGANKNEGAHKIGELDGIALYKVQQSIIPTNEILTIWKNPDNEGDVSIAFGTLVPFFSTGVIQRKNFYKEAGMNTYGDWHTINRRYFGIITIKNMKDVTYGA